MARIGVVVVALSFVLGGCASYFKRKECEKTNMYQHGYNVAMSGKRLDADDFVKQCKKVDAEFSWTDLDTGFKAGMSKYCNIDNVYQVGKAGKPFSYDMCDGESEKRMRAKYNDGLRVFCTPGSAYRFGTGGGVYENVCTPQEENAWLPEYRKGRKIYLKAVVDEKERESTRLEQEIVGLERRHSTLSIQQASLNRAVSRRKRVYDPVTKTYREEVIVGQDANAQARVDEVNGELNTVNYQLSQKRKQMTELQAELSKLRTEFATL